MTGHELVETRYGPMWVFQGDPGCSRLLKEYGEYSPLELETIKQYLPPGGTFVDIGAHIGAFTLPLAMWASKVIAVEPQREARELLERNIELAGLKNVEVLPYALAHETGTAHYSVKHATWANSYGSVGMEPNAFEGSEEATMVTLDSLQLQPDFVKIDAEGMEMHILMGGMQTIQRLHPPILVERPWEQDAEKAQIQMLTMMGYYIARLDFPMHLGNNFKHQTQDLFAGKAHMMQICLPAPR